MTGKLVKSPLVILERVVLRKREMKTFQLWLLKIRLFVLLSIKIPPFAFACRKTKIYSEHSKRKRFLARCTPACLALFV